MIKAAFSIEGGTPELRRLWAVELKKKDNATLSIGTFEDEHRLGVVFADHVQEIEKTFQTMDDVKDEVGCREIIFSAVNVFAGTRTSSFGVLRADRRLPHTLT